MIPSKNANIIFFVVGFLLLVISSLVLYANYSGKPEYATKFLDFLIADLAQLAFVLLTVVILNVSWSLLGGEPLSKTVSDIRNSTEPLLQSVNDIRNSTDLLRDSQRSGALRLMSKSAEFGTPEQWMARLKGAQQQVDLMGYTLHVWTRGSEFEENIVRLVRDGVRVRMLIMSARNPYLDAFINTDLPGLANRDYSLGEISGAGKAFSRIQSRVAQGPGSFELRTAERGIVACQICRTDMEMTVIPYLYSRVASLSPLMFIHGIESDLFQEYNQEFEHLWALNASPPQGAVPIISAAE